MKDNVKIPSEITNKSSNPIITVEDETFFSDIGEIVKLKENLKLDKNRLDLLSKNIKEIGKREWLRLYKEGNKNPGSILMEQEINGVKAQSLFIVKDQYKKIDEDASDLLSDIYGSDIIEETTVYSFNNLMVEKYGSVLSELIINSPDIDEADKSKIIEQTVNYSIKKGTLDKMEGFVDDVENNGDVSAIFEAVSPVMSLSSEKIVK